MIFFAILSARITSFFLRLFGKGATTLPGRAALFFKYDILTKLSQSVRVICVTGTNGKTTTCALLNYALENADKSCFINKSGANMLSGVTTAFVLNSTLFGRCKKDFAILECDENSLPLISRYLDAEVLAVTNVFRDQLDRYGEVTHTLGAIENSIRNMPCATLALNADCPLTYSLSRFDNDTVTFGVNGNFGGVDISEARYCPVCSAELLYDSRVFAHLGKYRCKRCGYSRKNADYEAENITLLGENGSEFTLKANGTNTPVSLTLGGIYNVYNYICAAAVLDVLGVGSASSLCGFEGAFGRTEYFRNDKTSVLLMLVKNPVGFSSCASYASKIKGADSIIIAINDNAADGRDVSWLWDSDIDCLSSVNARFYTFGLRAWDMTLRLKYGGIDVCETLDGEDMSKLMKIVKSSRYTIVLANYTSMMKIRKSLRRYFGGKEFWE
ncbi:MAG: DUF1727 domain-containing protein [Eubacterium sp.]|nr:DUF1727 domain-containing protein [Eubacterium sp.]